MTALLHWRCHWRTSVGALFNVVLALMPLAAVFVMWEYSAWQSWSFFWKNGEFYIYSVVFLASALYTLMDLGPKKSDFAKFMLVWIILMLITSVILYGNLVRDTIIPTDAKPNQMFIGRSSIALLVLSFISYYISSYWQNYREMIASEMSDDRVQVDIISSNVH